jgi:hypothetical protein
MGRVNWRHLFVWLWMLAILAAVIYMALTSVW